MTGRIWLCLALAACGSSKQSEPAVGSGSAITAAPPGDGGNVITLLGDDLPDASWEAAAKVALDAWRESFDKIGVASVVAAPLASPGGAVVPHLMVVTARDATGKDVFRGAALVHLDAKTMINGNGPVRMAAYLKSIDFPANRIAAEHVAEILHLTGSVKDDWIRPAIAPASAPSSAYRHQPPKIAYTASGATLELARDTPDGKRETLVVTFAPDATFTTATR